MHRWKKRWFKDLGPRGRDIWNWLLDSVYETYGVWEIDLRDIEYILGYKVTMEEIRTVFGPRIHEFGNGKLFIPEAIVFQYGELSDACNPHKPVLRELRRLGLYELYLELLANSKEGVYEPTKTNTKTGTRTNSSSVLEDGRRVIESASDLMAAIPLVTRDQFKHKYPETWLNEEIENCFNFHYAETATRPQNSGQWMKKLHSWILRAWRDRKQNAKGNHDDLDALDLTTPRRPA